MIKIKELKAILFDLDGVLYVGDRPIEGAAEAVRAVKERGLLCRFVSNTTTRSVDSLLTKLRALDLPVERDELLTAVSAGVGVLRARPTPPRVRLLLRPDSMRDFAEFEKDERTPDVIVAGEYGEGWTFALINEVFRQMVHGAELLALHKGRYYQEPDGLRIDTGAFVTGLEYASGKRATVVGKPERGFFEQALRDTGITVEQAAMVGDDVISDVGGAQAAGLGGILVRTGKYRQELVAQSSVTPDATLDSVRDLPALLAEI